MVSLCDLLKASSAGRISLWVKRTDNCAWSLAASGLRIARGRHFLCAVGRGCDVSGGDEAAREKAKNQHQKVTCNTMLQVETLTDLGVSRIQSSRWQQEASVPEETFQQYIDESNEKETEITQASAKTDRSIFRVVPRHALAVGVHQT